jgi:amino-acid N-acetyltransferase
MIYHKYKLTDVKISSAAPQHAKEILRLLKPYFDAGVILFRDKKNIISHIHNFTVAEYCGKLVGCIAVRDFKNGLYEIRSLVVDAEVTGKGIGSALIAYSVDLINELMDGKKVFALTLRPNVFTLVGFKLVVKEMFPEKVWHDCEKCGKKEHCDEVAVLYEF